MTRQKRPFEKGDICPKCKKARVKIIPRESNRDHKHLVECTAQQGCMFSISAELARTSDYDQLKDRMDLIISNQKKVY